MHLSQQVHQGIGLGVDTFNQVSNVLLWLPCSLFCPALTTSFPHLSPSPTPLQVVSPVWQNPNWQNDVGVLVLFAVATFALAFAIFLWQNRKYYSCK